MKLVADVEALHDAFQYAGSIISSSLDGTIYRNVKLDAGPEETILSSSDMEVGLRVRADGVEVQEEGVVLVPEENVSRILDDTLDEKVTLETEDENALQIRSSDGYFRILSHPTEDFQDLEEPEDCGKVEVDPEIYSYMVRRTTFAAAAERGRYALHGILLSLEEDGTFKMVAADGRRLANVTKKADNPDGEEFWCLVPKKGIQQMSRLAKLSDEPLWMTATEGKFFAGNDRGMVGCVLVEGQFPDYKSIVPASPKYNLELPTRELLSAVRRTGYMTTSETKAVDFQLEPGRLVISSESPELGQGEVEMEIEYNGEEGEVTFNPDLLEDMLSLVERESVKFQFNDPESPCMFKSGFDYTYLISPIVPDEEEEA